MRRNLSILLAGLFLAAGLAACDDPAGGGGQQQPPPAPQSQPAQ
ncbi:MAG: hypothetical protein ACFCUT_12810 [Kiloniellaceae bacterium]